jgi:Rod binding domain-containing protein
MSVAPLNPKINAANLPLERLAASTQVNDREKIAEVSRQFEAVLLRQILSQAQKPLFNSSLVSGGGGASQAIYQDMVTQQLADRISQGGTFGFGKVLEKELSARYTAKTPVELKPLKLSPAAQTVAPPTGEAPSSAPTSKKYITVTTQPGKRI